MTPILRLSSSFATLFCSWFGLVDHRIAWRGWDHRSFWPSARFSAWFGRSSRRSQLRHNFSHRPADLLWRSFTLGRLPGTQRGLHLWTRQHQVIVHNGDDLTPAFKLRWGAQPGLCPQQALLVKAIAMLVRIAPPVAQGHRRQAGLGRPLPQKPTLTRVAGPIAGPLSQDADDRHLNMSCLGQMQPRPPADLNGMSVGISALPTAIGWSIGTRIAATSSAPHLCAAPRVCLWAQAPGGTTRACV